MSKTEYIHSNIYGYDRSQMMKIFGSEEGHPYNLHFHSNPLGFCILTCWHKLSLGCTPLHLMEEIGIKYWLVLTRQLTIILWIVFLLFHLNYPSSHDVYCKFKYLVNNPITLLYKYSVIQLILKIKRLGMHLICIIIP